MKSAPSLRHAPLRISSAVGGLLKAYSVAASAFLGANGVESEDFGGAWSKQELFKGCALWYGVNAVLFSGAEIEGGWGINAQYVANPLAYIPLSGFNASYVKDYTREDLIANPLFTSFNDERMASTNALVFSDVALRAKMLGDFVPEKWVVTNDVRIVMRKMGNPIPLCAKRVKRWDENGLHPAGIADATWLRPPPSADTKPSAIHLDKSWIWNLCRRPASPRRGQADCASQSRMDSPYRRLKARDRRLALAKPQRLAAAATVRRPSDSIFRASASFCVSMAVRRDSPSISRKRSSASRRETRTCRTMSATVILRQAF